MTNHKPGGDSHTHAEHHAPRMGSAETSQHRTHELPTSAHSHESQQAFSKETVVPTNGSKDFLVIVEPHAALFRYLEVAQRNYRTLVLSSSPESCLAGEAKYNRSMAHSHASHIDQIIKCDIGISEARLRRRLLYAHSIV